MLHNDIKANNILLTDCTTESQMREKYIQIVLIDFGKATPIQNDCKYNLSDAEKAKYFRKYPHISPEVIEGLTTKTPSSDIYSAGYVMLDITLCKIMTPNTHPVMHKNSLEITELTGGGLPLKALTLTQLRTYGA